MTAILPPSMTEALRLTRSGRLGDAAALIRQTLGGGLEAAARTAAESWIDLTGSVGVSPPALRLASRPANSPAGIAGDSAGASFQELTYRSAAGKLAYRLYVPAGATAGLPLVVMLHGCSQTPEDFARGTGMNRLADELNFLVAYPAQSKTANPQKCWNWFKPCDQQRDRGEPALIAGLTRQVISERGADASRVYVAGLSAGGAAAAIMGSAYPDLYAAVGIHSGLACGAARDLPSALMAMSGGGRAAAARSSSRFTPVITFHGDRDTTVNESNSREIVAAASAASGDPLHTRSDTGVSPGGRPYTRVVSLSAQDQERIEQWTIHGGGHAWSGGDKAGSFTDPAGPDASREMLRFFLSHKLRAGRG